MTNRNIINKKDSEIISAEDPTQVTGSNRTIISAVLTKAVKSLYPIDFHALMNGKRVRNELELKVEQLQSEGVSIEEPTSDGALEDLGNEDVQLMDQVVGEQGIKAKQYKVLFVDYLIKKMQTLGYPIADFNSETRIYSSRHWLTFDKNLLYHFLCEAGLRMGIPPLIAKDVDFIQSCHKQLQVAAYQKVKDESRTLLNFQNGTLEFLPDGSYELNPHSPEDLLRFVLPYEYDEEAEFPQFQKFLDRVVPEDDKQLVLSEFIASCFSPIKHEKVLLLYGGGANGKSVFLDVITALLGSDNVSSHTLESLTATNGYAVGQLGDCLLNYSGEISKRLNSDGFKKLASREKMPARYPYGRPFEIEDYARLAFNCNELPEAQDISEGFYRRFLIIPFENYIPKDQRNPYLARDIISDELPGIMNWVIAGLNRLHLNHAFSKCESAEKMLEQYKKQTNTALEFIESDVFKKIQLPIKASLAYKRYKLYCEDHGLNPSGSKAFYQQMKACGISRSRRSDGSYYGA